MKEERREGLRSERISDQTKRPKENKDRERIKKKKEDKRREPRRKRRKWRIEGVSPLFAFPLVVPTIALHYLSALGVLSHARVWTQFGLRGLKVIVQEEINRSNDVKFVIIIPFLRPHSAYRDSSTSMLSLHPYK